MRAAKIVFIILAIFLLLPWLVYNIKTYINLKANKKKFSTGRILSYVLISVLMITVIYSLYQFTIGYQIPLVAERYGEIFSQRIEGKLDLSQFEARIEKQKLSGLNSKIITDTEMEQAGFETKRYQLSISERTYPLEDEDGNMLIYLKHDDGQSSLYTLLQLEQIDHKWQVYLHEVLSQDDFDELNNISRIRFFDIKN